MNPKIKLNHTLCGSVCEICQACERYLTHILGNLTPIVIIYTLWIAGLPFGLSINLQGTVHGWLPFHWASQMQCLGLRPKPCITLIIDAQLKLIHYLILYQTKPWLTNMGIHQTPFLINISRFSPNTIRYSSHISISPIISQLQPVDKLTQIDSSMDSSVRQSVGLFLYLILSWFMGGFCHILTPYTNSEPMLWDHGGQSTMVSGLL